MIIETITSRQNALVKTLVKLAANNTAYRKAGAMWLEGDHLLQALHTREFGANRALRVFLHPDHQSLLQTDWLQEILRRDESTLYYLDAKLWSEVSCLGTPAHVGALLEWDDYSSASEIDPNAPTVVLDRIQDIGNVGAILRCASAFGFTQIIALKGCAAIWGSKLLRAGMGAHFNLHIVESASVDTVQQLKVPLLATSSHGGSSIKSSTLPFPCAWLLGNEGQGLAADLAQLATHHIRIEQPGGEESLNVATAAAICLHASVPNTAD